MKGVAPWEGWAVVQTVDESGRERPAADIAVEACALPTACSFRIAGRPLSAETAAELFRRLAATPRRYFATVALDAIERKSILEDAARSGCVALEVRREGTLVDGLASGLGSNRGAFSRTVTALRRARGLGIATVARLDLGRPGDDEGVFERTLRFCRRALVAVPIVERATNAEDHASGGELPRGAMDHATVDNGIRWVLARFNRHVDIWRRALWPAGARATALRIGYGLRRASGRATGHYTATMHLLRLLNRTERTRRTGRLLSTLAAGPVEPARRCMLRVRATANERLAVLFIAVDGALDVRGARALLEQVREALQAGFQRITIDFAGLEWVSADVVTRFLAENRTRLVEIARWIQLENLQDAASALRRQLGDVEGIRLIEVAASRA